MNLKTARTLSDRDKIGSRSVTSSPFQPGMEGPRSSATVPKEERILSKEGLEDKEERDSHAPEGLPF